MNTQILEEIGLTPGEIKAYLALLKLGSASTGPIAKESQLSRSKLYIILDKLEKKGLASHIEKNNVLYYQPAEPSRIKNYLREKEDKLYKLESEFEALLPKLLNYQSSGNNLQRVAVYQGLKGLITVHEYMYSRLKKGDCYCSIGIPSTQPKTQHIFWQRDHERRVMLGIKAKLLFNKDTPKNVLKNRNTYKGCDARFMPIDLNTPAYFEMYADTTMIVIPSDSPITIEIINKEITRSFMVYFEEFWKKSKR